MSEDRDPIAILNHEHHFIKKVIGALDRLAGTAESAVSAKPDTLREVVRFMREFADRCHHAKEEGLLFPAMEAKGVPESGCPLGALLREHENGRELVGALANATEALAGQTPGAEQKIAETVGKIKELYSNHIWKEDEMVFPMVSRLFSESERFDLFKQFEKAEEEIGADREALATFADALEKQTSTN